MSQKKKKIERQKLKDQAEILYTSSLSLDIGTGKLDLIAKAIQRVQRIDCPERTMYFKEAISICETLKLWKTARQLAELALRKSDEKEFFLDISQKYHRMNNGAPKPKSLGIVRDKKVRLVSKDIIP